MPMRSQAKLKSLLSRLERAVEESEPKDDMLAVFARRLFEVGNLIDLEAFSAEELAGIAADALAFVARRRPGKHKVRVASSPVGDAEHRRPFTVIEVANDDMPFLVESVLAELADQGAEVFLVVHPVLWVERDAKGAIKAIGESEADLAGRGRRESFIHMHIERIASQAACAALEARLGTIMADVRVVVLDWQPMRARLEKAIAGYRASPPPVPVDELAEAIQFMQWLAEDHFTFLGMREYALDGDLETGNLVEIEELGLGVLRNPSVRVLRRGAEMVTMTAEVRDFLRQPSPLIVAKANVHAHIHRRAYMEYVGIKQFDAEGRLKGELRIVGLFTSAAYTRSARAIPLLRRKVDLVLSMSGVEPTGHYGRALVNVLESYPRDELFQIDVETLSDISLGILQLAERPRTRIFTRRDPFDRFVSVLVYVPRDSYDTTVRIRIGEILAEAYDGRVSAFYPAYPEGTLARVHFIVGRNERHRPEPDIAELEQRIAEAARRWDENLKRALEQAHRPESAAALFDTYGGGFSAAYQDSFDCQTAMHDMAKMESLTGQSPLALELLPEDGADGVHLRLYHANGPIALSDRLPILEDLGFRAISERSFEVERRGEGADRVWLHDIVLELAGGGPFDMTDADPLLEEAFLAVWRGAAEDDGYNRILRFAARPWREVAVLRAVGKYLQQVGIPFSQGYMAATLTLHHDIAADLIALFRCRFDPATGQDAEARGAEAGQIVARIEEALEGVAVLDEDRIIRRFMNVIAATLRTNYYQTGEAGAERPAMAMKLDSAAIEGLPKPRPHVEIFVYSPRVEGVHLRGGPIARGGLRWSDRPQDFRTEILGLAKAQHVKNAVIVPVGAKGGFVPQRLPREAGRDEIRAEGIACYKIFVGSLLDVTDNLAGDRVVPPADVVRHDGDDPYLVVAADKGTATFSDIANSISTERGFWLGDAFASGGSAGYDHKAMGITARGAWEAVKRHFREMDRDIQSEPFTVVGVGDMSGDVFGNGMLLSKKTRLVAAFDHRDIFIDPDPDPEVSFAERKRLFRLERSSWQDYKPALISKGGGVFSRAQKSIPLSPEIKALTGLTRGSATVAELIGALLKADADLLWFGGIGTYVKAAAESDVEVGDRGNDAIRVTAAQLRAKVVGEGANLGVTQLGRIEFARAGGRINSDAIDNSAGVNTSDVEVNIKIALKNAIDAGKLKEKARNGFLAAMTEEVGHLVLRNNYEQTLCLSLAVHRGTADLGFQIRLMDELEERGLLDRAVEFLPDDLALAEREERGEALTRPELAVLLAYGKIALFGDLLDCDVPDDAYFGRELVAYFPAKMGERYGEAIQGHRLRREIIATMLANSIINRGGSTMVQRLRDETGADASEVCAAFALARDVHDLEDLFAEVDALDNKVPNRAQTEIYVELQDLIRRQTVWFLRQARDADGIEPVVRHFHEGVGRIAKVLGKVLSADLKARARAREDELRQAGVPQRLARRVAQLPMLQRAPDIVVVADAAEAEVERVAEVFFGLGQTLEIDWLLDQAADLAASDYYDRLALNRLIENIQAAQRRLTAEAFAEADGKDVLEGWIGRHARPIERAREAIRDLADSGALTLAKLQVAGAHMHDLVHD